MKRMFTLALALIASTQLASAQNGAPTTVQLPTFSFFTYNGTVVVPDGGSTHLGGVKRAATGSARRGLSRGFGSDLSRSDAIASVQIIDLAEMDEAILGGTPKEFLARARAQEAAALAAANGQTLPKAADPDAEGKALVRYARSCLNKGDQSGAFDVYMMAIDKLSSARLQQLAAAEFKRNFGPAAEQAMRMRRLRR